MAKLLMASNKKARELYETGAVVKRSWARYNGDGPQTRYSFQFPAMKTKGFTLVELVVACTLLIMLSTIATTSTYNFVQATANLKAQYNNIQNIMALHSVLVNAKMNYATDLAVEASSNPTGVEAEIQLWNRGHNKIIVRS